MCAGHEHPPREEGNIRSFFHNLAGAEGNLPAKLAKASLNLLRRGPRRAGCCGNYGEPGC
jgi:hypothetical protein